MPATKKGSRYKAFKPLYKKCWDQWSIYVRASAADWKGEAQCFTCGKRDRWRLLQAGHFHHGHLDFEPLNIHPQCARCNKWLHGNLNEYAHALVKKYGPDIFDRLAELKKNETPPTIIELQQKLEHLRKLNKQHGYI